MYLFPIVIYPKQFDVLGWQDTNLELGTQSVNVCANLLNDLVLIYFLIGNQVMLQL